MSVHGFRTRLSWAGSTGVGYPAYSREHQVECLPVASELTLSADENFLGDPRLLNPEQLLLAAASSCQLLSFLAVAARARIDVVEYRDDAEAIMPTDDPPIRITEIVLRPRITVRGSLDRIPHLIEVAHRECFIANSLTAKITIQPTILAH